MRWFEHLARLTEQRTPLVMVTLMTVRGHAPQEAGAKMLVTAGETFGTIGGGNLEATAVNLARNILQQKSVLQYAPTSNPQIHTIRLTDKAPAEYGLQCCGGEVQILLEPVLSTQPTVAVFGVGHVGLALAKVLSICPVEFWLVDSRAEMLSSGRLVETQRAASLQTHHAPIPELVVGELPSGSHLLVMTHDHAEDIAILDAALRRPDLGFIGLIGSSAKWANFQQKLLQQGFSRDDLTRVTCPIGFPGIESKAPEAIAIATAAQLMPLLMPSPVQSPEIKEPSS
jgi:xanthine dehydrogenase accessory factor